MSLLPSAADLIATPENPLTVEAVSFVMKNGVVVRQTQ